ncbi:reelin domain-containing protein 1 [Microcaecilia unicolor]|uniref:Reelin domain-containing protein 1 n=1 Tax=Microcaecilia unicolor TaxID=1415580 RepID=A0A6P7XD54_9AMPH|nr:reelin domain-containing protein 1 [Microcaecilia unicolor]
MFPRQLGEAQNPNPMRNMSAKVDDGLKMQVVLIGWACMTLCLVSYTAAFSHGASLSACADMRPNHIRAQPQNLKKNYISIYTNKSFYLPGDKVPVTVRSTRDFMGFLLQARRVSDDEITGTFVFIPPGSKLLTCFEDGDSVTHSDKSLKRNLSFVWKAPDQPVGDIKFFLSVVQSYFVYWARIESAIISDQTQNKTYSAQGDSNNSSTIAPSHLQRAGEEDVNASANEGMTPYSSALVQNTSPTSANLTWTTVEVSHQSGLPLEDELDVTGDGKYLPSLSPALATTSLSERAEMLRSSSTHSDQGLEPSLQTERLGLSPAFLSDVSEDDSSSYGTWDDRSENISSSSALQLCSTCDSGMRAESLASSLTVASPGLHTSQPWDTQTFLPLREILPHVSIEDDVNISSRSSLRQKAERQSVTKVVSADFMQQSENADSEVAESEAGHTPPAMTEPVRETVVPGKGEDKPSRGMQLAAAQLGILLGCSAALGMALAAGLRCIHAQYCHKRTEVSFSEPDSSIITVRENGEMMHFRKIRENSFVLVQAEYNWITPSANGKK